MRNFRALGAALAAMACAAPPSPPSSAPPEPVAAAPAPAPLVEPAPAPSAAPEVLPGDAGTDAAPAGPTADNPGYSDVASLAGPHLPDGHYFVDGDVGKPLPCKQCPKPPACKPGGNCPPFPDCASCSPTLVLEHAGASISIELPGGAPAFRLGERVRIVLEKRGGKLAFSRRSKPCPPSRCLETEPPIPLDSAAKGAAVRRDGERCYAKRGCPPNAKCDPDADTRVRCP